jgi:hypothetical protein
VLEKAELKMTDHAGVNLVDNFSNAIINKGRMENNKFDFRLRLIQNELKKTNQTIERNRYTFLQKTNSKRKDWWRKDFFNRETARKEHMHLLNKSLAFSQEERNVLVLPELKSKNETTRANAFKSNSDQNFIQKEQSTENSQTNNVKNMQEIQNNKVNDQIIKRSLSEIKVKETSSIAEQNVNLANFQIEPKEAPISPRPSVRLVKSDLQRRKTNEIVSQPSKLPNLGHRKDVYSQSADMFLNKFQHSSSKDLIDSSYTATVERFLKYSPFYIESRITLRKIEAEKKFFRTEIAKGKVILTKKDDRYHNLVNSLSQNKTMH